MALYGILTEQSIGQLFVAGVIPSALSALIYMMITVRATLNPSLAPPGQTRVNWGEFLRLVFSAWPSPVLVLGILGGIFGGVSTPTEAGAVGASLALLVALLRRRSRQRR